MPKPATIGVDSSLEPFQAGDIAEGSVLACHTGHMPWVGPCRAAGALAGAGTKWWCCSILKQSGRRSNGARG
jgi:hypothetical protein